MADLPIGRRPYIRDKVGGEAAPLGGAPYPGGAQADPYMGLGVEGNFGMAPQDEFMGMAPPEEQQDPQALIQMLLRMMEQQARRGR